MTGQQAKGLAWVVAAFAAALMFAAGLPWFAARVPWRVETTLGGFFATEGFYCEKNPAAQAALEKLTARLYPVLPGDRDFPLTVRVSGRQDVNAVAGLGGRVVVYDGLVREAQSPEEVAGVLAHEIEHVKRRHIIQGFVAKLVTTGALRYVFSQKGAAAGALLNLSFSRDEEREADDGGLARLRAAKIDAAGFAAFFARAEKRSSVPAMLSDHPSDSRRAELARQYLGGPSEPVLSPQEWRELRGICR